MTPRAPVLSMHWPRDKAQIVQPVGTSVAMVFEYSPQEGDDLQVNLRGWDVREDGTVYLPARDERDEQVFFGVTPIDS